MRREAKYGGRLWGGLSRRVVVGQEKQRNYGGGSMNDYIHVLSVDIVADSENNWTKQLILWEINVLAIEISTIAHHCHWFNTQVLNMTFG